MNKIEVGCIPNGNPNRNGRGLYFMAAALMCISALAGRTDSLLLG